MNALLNLLAWDLRLQLRQKFWHAGGILCAIYILILFFVPDTQVDFWISALLFSEVCTIGLLLIAGAIFLERREGSVFALAVSPIHTRTWLLSKMASITVLGTTLGSIIILLNGENVNWIRVPVALTLGTAFYTLLGIILVSPVKTITQYFPLLFIALSVTSVPVYWHFGLIEHPLLWLLPSYPIMKLLAGCLNDMPTAEFYSAALIVVLWTLLTLKLSTQFFHRYISQRRG